VTPPKKASAVPLLLLLPHIGCTFKPATAVSTVHWNENSEIGTADTSDMLMDTATDVDAEDTGSSGDGGESEQSGDSGESTPEAPGIYQSCQELLDQDPDSASGAYILYPDGTTAVEIHCVMQEGEGWMRIAAMDFEDVPCPGDWTPREGGICERAPSSPGLSGTARFESLGFEWSQAWFTLAASTTGSMDAWGNQVSTGATVEEAYVDGISLTVGTAGQRVHLYSYGIGHPGSSYCPGSGSGSATEPQSFVGNSWTCGTEGESSPLFEGEWKKAGLTESTLDDIEIRLMSDQGPGNENPGLRSLVLRIR
jgi:hypothetical protein